jgi:hypothetical protein
MPTMAAREKLAIDGGPKTVKAPLGHWPQFDAATVRAVADVLRSGKVNYWTGPKGMEFEEKFARWMGCKFAVSTTNGTSALHVALAGLGIGPGDEVIVPSYTFIATAFSVCQAGAVPRFADVNREDHCLSVESARRLINRRTRAIKPVHLYGNVCDMHDLELPIEQRRMRSAECGMRSNNNGLVRGGRCAFHSALRTLLAIRDPQSAIRNGWAARSSPSSSRRTPRRTCGRLRRPSGR